MAEVVSVARYRAHREIFNAWQLFDLRAPLREQYIFPRCVQARTLLLLFFRGECLKFFVGWLNVGVRRIWGKTFLLLAKFGVLEMGLSFIGVWG